MFHCITKDQEVIHASACEEEKFRKLSRENNLFCPDCGSIVCFNKGDIKQPYFSHVTETDCIPTKYENESPEHILGKKLLFNLIKNKFPNAKIELEVYIPETNQIADILLTHSSEDKTKVVRWAFEFQHSDLLISDWKKRHTLYQSENIHDIWVLDAQEFLQYSTAADGKNARSRYSLEKEIFNKTGFCYFLNLNTKELTIDFNFRTVKKPVKGKPYTNPYIFHSPLKHSCNLNDVLFLYDLKVNYSAMAYKEDVELLTNKCKSMIKRLEQIKKEQAKNKFQQKTKEKIKYITNSHGENFKEITLSFIEINEQELQTDVYNLSAEEFHSKYNTHLSRIQQNEEEIERWKETDVVNQKILSLLPIYELTHKICFLEEQETDSLETLLSKRFSEKLETINYVLNTHANILTILESGNAKRISQMLSKIDSRLVPLEFNPTKFHYAIKCSRYNSTKQIDEVMTQINEKLFPKREYDLTGFDFDKF
ncbi:competence protein CoiA [Bacillus cereus group sp. MYBK71-2]|uniref:competence protein CoiA n=1 Tax=Bacillus cereus group sp. MYBK71-2 TaxID=3450611 RepID=UPI003F79CD63